LEPRQRKFLKISGVIIFLTVIVVASVPFLWKTFWVKEEPLPPHERWQILDFNYVEDVDSMWDSTTYITLKYLGENNAQGVRVWSTSDVGYGFLSESGLVSDGQQEFHKGEIGTVARRDYIVSICISWYPIDDPVHSLDAWFRFRNDSRLAPVDGETYINPDLFK